MNGLHHPDDAFQWFLNLRDPPNILSFCFISFFNNSLFNFGGQCFLRISVLQVLNEVDFFDRNVQNGEQNLVR